MSKYVFVSRPIGQRDELTALESEEAEVLRRLSGKEPAQRPDIDTLTVRGSLKNYRSIGEVAPFFTPLQIRAYLNRVAK